jgi:hypothetical protein
MSTRPPKPQISNELRDRIFGNPLAPANADEHLRNTREALELTRTMQF